MKEPHPCSTCPMAWIDISGNATDGRPTRVCFDSCPRLKTYEEEKKIENFDITNAMQLHKDLEEAGYKLYKDKEV